MKLPFGDSATFVGLLAMAVLLALIAQGQPPESAGPCRIIAALVAAAAVLLFARDLYLHLRRGIEVHADGISFVHRDSRLELAWDDIDRIDRDVERNGVVAALLGMEDPVLIVQRKRRGSIIIRRRSVPEYDQLLLHVLGNFNVARQPELDRLLGFYQRAGHKVGSS